MFIIPFSNVNRNKSVQLVLHSIEIFIALARKIWFELTYTYILYIPYILIYTYTKAPAIEVTIFGRKLLPGSKRM